MSGKSGHAGIYAFAGFMLVTVIMRSPLCKRTVSAQDYFKRHEQDTVTIYKFPELKHPSIYSLTDDRQLHYTSFVFTAAETTADTAKIKSENGLFGQMTADGVFLTRFNGTDSKFDTILSASNYKIED